jgi:hypothetical protein
VNPWFSPDAGRWFALLSLLSLLALSVPLIMQGRSKALVLGGFAAALALGIVLLAAAGVAALSGQPGHVSGTLGIGGVVLTVVFASILPVVVKGYREAEHRKMLARDM